jgi:hypothetical protein
MPCRRDAGGGRARPRQVSGSPPGRDGWGCPRHGDGAAERGAGAGHGTRIGIYRPWTANMDEGWTRWLLDHYGVPYRTLTNEEIRGGGLADVDVVLLAGQNAQSILHGYPAGRMPEPYTGGIGDRGVEALRSFVEGGGRIVALDDANDFLAYQFDIPVGNALAGLGREEFYIPGSLVRIRRGSGAPGRVRHAAGGRGVLPGQPRLRRDGAGGGGRGPLWQRGHPAQRLGGGGRRAPGGRPAVVRVPYGRATWCSSGSGPSSGDSPPGRSSCCSTPCRATPEP